MTYNKLKQYRLERDMTQQQLADASGIYVRQIQKIEKGESEIGNIAAKNIIALADALDIDPHDLLRPLGKVVNEYDVEIDFEVAVHFMDDDIREALHRELAPCSEQTFFNAYCEAHEAAYNTPFEFATENPSY